MDYITITKEKNLKKILIIFIILIIIIVSLFKIIKVQDIILKRIYPTTYSEYVDKYAKKYNVDPLLVYSIIKAESNFDPNVNSSSKAVGLMQIMEDTATEIAKSSDIKLNNIEDLYEPETNIQIGIAYFASLKEKYNNNPQLALIAYNAGFGNVDKWIREGTIKPDGSDVENVPFKETNSYVRKILRDYEIYKKLYGR